MQHPGGKDLKFELQNMRESVIKSLGLFESRLF